MESKIGLLCLVAFLALSAGVAYTQAQSTEKIDTSTTPVASPSNGSEPNTTVSMAPTTAAPSTATVPTSAVPTSAVPTSAVPSTAAPTTGSNSTGTSIPTVVPTAGGTTDGTVTYDYNGTTPASTPSATTFQPCTAHSFDAASFVGGIVLGLGVCIIVFFIYKWYQSRHPTAAPYQQF